MARNLILASAALMSFFLTASASVVQQQYNERYSPQVPDITEKLEPVAISLGAITKQLTASNGAGAFQLPVPEQVDMDCSGSKISANNLTMWIKEVEGCLTVTKKCNTEYTLDGQTFYFSTFVHTENVKKYTQFVVTAVPVSLRVEYGSGDVVIDLVVGSAVPVSRSYGSDDAGRFDIFNSIHDNADRQGRPTFCTIPQELSDRLVDRAVSVFGSWYKGAAEEIISQLVTEWE